MKNLMIENENLKAENEQARRKILVLAEIMKFMLEDSCGECFCHSLDGDETEISGAVCCYCAARKALGVLQECTPTVL